MILITRQRRFALKTSNNLADHGYKAIVMPLWETRYIYTSIEDQYDAVILTSKNAIYASNHLSWLKKKRLYTIGADSKDLLQNMYSKNVHCCNDKEQNSDGILRLIEQHEPLTSRILYLSGAVVAGNITERLQASGYTITREIVYQMISLQTLSTQMIDTINHDINIIALYSPKAAILFQSLALQHHIPLANKTCVCISNNVANHLIHDKWLKVLVTPHSNEASMIATIGKIN